MNNCKSNEIHKFHLSSKHEWVVLDTGVHSAEVNMQVDTLLLQGLDKEPILHFYDWENDSATYGYFVKPEKFLNLKEVSRLKLDLAKRPTGGGIVFHIWDLAFSVLVPSNHPNFSKNTLENYAFVNQAVLDAVKEFLDSSTSLELIEKNATALDPFCKRFCMAQPTKYDVVYQGRKIAGAAQRTSKKGFLHQGSISLKMPSEEYLKAVLLPETRVFEAIQENTFPLLKKEDDLKEGRKLLREKIQKNLIRDHQYV